MIDAGNFQSIFLEKVQNALRIFSIGGFVILQSLLDGPGGGRLLLNRPHNSANLFADGHLLSAGIYCH
jgi:hypothetical protein